MVARVIRLALCAALITAVAGCTEDAGPSTGSEGGACLPDGFCSASLVCADQTCVRSTGVDAGANPVADAADVAIDAREIPPDAGDMCVFPPSCQQNSDCTCPPPDGLNTCCFSNECGFHGVPCN